MLVEKQPENIIITSAGITVMDNRQPFSKIHQIRRNHFWKAWIIQYTMYDLEYVVYRVSQQVLDWKLLVKIIKNFIDNFILEVEEWGL